MPVESTPTTTRFRRALPLVLGALIAAPVLLAAPVDDAADDWAAGNAQSAVIRLKSMLQKTPDDAAARLLLGRIYLATGDAAAAELELQRARRSGADDAETLPPLIESLLAQDKVDQALALAEPTDDMPAPLRARLLSLRGDALISQGRADAARAALDEARAADPGSVAALLGLAQIALDAGEIDKARALVEQATATAPGDADAWKALGMLAYQEGRFEDAVAAYDKAVEAAPNRWQLHFARGAALLETQDATRARQDLESLTRLSPSFPGRFYLSGRLALRADEPGQALNDLERYLRAAPEDPRGIFFAALAMHRLGRNAQAEEYLERLHAHHPDSTQTALLLARIRLANGDAAGAERLLRPYAERADASLAVLETLRAALASRGMDDEAAALIARAAREHPQYLPAQLAYARVLLSQDRAAEALPVLRRVIEAEPNQSEPRLLLVRALMLSGDLEAARAAADALLEAAPGSPEAHMADAALRAQQGDVGGARAAFERARTLAPDSGPQQTRVMLALAALEMSADQPDAARKVLEHLLARQPGQTQAVLALAALARHEAQAGDGNAGTAEAAFASVIRKGLETAPDNLQLRLVLAQIEGAAGRPEAALEVLRQAPSAQADEPRLLALRAQAELAAGHPSLARTTLGRLAEQEPHSAEVCYRQAAASAAAADANATRTHLTEGLDLERRPLLTPGRLTRILAQLPSDSVREQILAELLRVAPAHPALQVVDARYALARRDFASAIGTLQRLQKAHPDQRLYTMDLAGALHAAGRDGTAEQLLTDWVDEHPQQTAPRLLLAQVELSRGDTDAAKQQYRSVIETAASNPVALNNLAMLLADGDPEEARGYAERALARRPDDPAYIDTMGTVLLALGDAEQARDLLARAHAGTPDPGIAFRYAKALAATGDDAAARRVLLQLQTRSFPEHDEAQALLEALAKAR